MEHATGTVLLLSRDARLAGALSGALSQACRFENVCDVTNLFGRIEELSPEVVILDADGIASDLLSVVGRCIDTAQVLFVTDDEVGRLEAVKAGAADSFSREIDSELLREKVTRLLHNELIKKSLDRSIRHSKEKIAELEHAIQMIAHDLKSPAVAIEGFVRLLKRRYSPDRPDPKRDEILENLEKASKSIQELLWLFYQLLVSENVEIQWDRLSLTRVVHEVLDQHRHRLEKKNIEVCLDFDDPTAHVMGDRRRVSQVLDNLIVNALKHMGRPVQAQIRIQLRCGSDFVTASISDNGVGVPNEYRDKVFARFFRVPRGGGSGGTGLGLAIAKTIVERHGGSIWCEQGAERGATFCFTLPRTVPTEIVP